MRWQALAVYVGVHAAYALFLLGSLVYLPASNVPSSQLATLLMLDVFMAVSVYQASKVRGVVCGCEVWCVVMRCGVWW